MCSPRKDDSWEPSQPSQRATGRDRSKAPSEAAQELARLRQQKMSDRFRRQADSSGSSAALDTTSQHAAQRRQQPGQPGFSPAGNSDASGSTPLAGNTRQQLSMAANIDLLDDSSDDDSTAPPRASHQPQRSAAPSGSTVRHKEIKSAAEGAADPEAAAPSAAAPREGAAADAADELASCFAGLAVASQPQGRSMADELVDAAALPLPNADHRRQTTSNSASQRTAPAALDRLEGSDPSIGGDTHRGAVGGRRTLSPPVDQASHPERGLQSPGTSTEMAASGPGAAWLSPLQPLLRGLRALTEFHAAGPNASSSHGSGSSPRAEASQQLPRSRPTVGGGAASDAASQREPTLTEHLLDRQSERPEELVLDDDGDDLHDSGASYPDASSDAAGDGGGDAEDSRAAGGEPLIMGETGEFRLEQPTAGLLYGYQVEGLRWMWQLWTMRRPARGGICGDDMGLGKTMQCAAFLSGMVHSKLIDRALVLAPMTLLDQWAKELKRCGLQGRIFEYHGSSKADRAHALAEAFRRRGVVLTTYGMVLHNAKSLSVAPCTGGRRGVRGASDEEDDDPRERKPLWQLMFLDEGHKIKNPKSEIYKALRTIPVDCRIILTGTPIQNNLMEAHSLFDFACKDLLGDAKWFKTHFSQTIERGNDKHALGRDREIARGRAAQLRDTIAPHFLRREKGSVQQLRPGEVAAEDDKIAQGKCGMPHKNDLIIWLQMQPQQRQIYESFLESEDVKQALNQTQSALAAITVLKKVCDHPALLSDKAATAVARKKVPKSDVRVASHRHRSASEDVSDPEDSDHLSADALPVADDVAAREQWREAQRGATSVVDQQLLMSVHDQGLDQSCKTRFIMALLDDLVEQGHRTLVFSQSRVMLDILQRACRARRFQCLRLDGSVASSADRAEIVARFQRDAGIPVCLLSSQVGGLGLTLTAANRVIVADPAWNPATDNQAVDRAYRIGQRRDVVVYRLITCGSVEEKIYRRQVFKGGLMRAGTQAADPTRYFSFVEMRDLFVLKPEEVCASVTQRDLAARHSAQRVCPPGLNDHLAAVARLPNFVGISDHDLLFSDDSEAPTGTGGSPSHIQVLLTAVPGHQSAVAAAVAAHHQGAEVQGVRLQGAQHRGLQQQGAEPCGVRPLAPPWRGVVPLPLAPAHPTAGDGSDHICDDLTSRLANGLTLGQSPAPSSRMVEIEEVKRQLAKSRSLLADEAMLRRLSDGGQNIRVRIAALQSRLQALETISIA
eukprot:CAMPEP_0206151388 /NCGR_PEP_ID=MMETSP1473-20131121/38795_1 /ASSEMBLY_ACC=CAM_ASM_001109 /TAXON_ID=1461547 /ORGANISM="Stichococcus sp, Strain RCC1054" /LENGTH=1241 /DNA_ID=CAMNT_0053548933 /DNA_START=394 /DNA_END=4120 /DNA_ORIENTATION=+